MGWFGYLQDLGVNTKREAIALIRREMNYQNKGLKTGRNGTERTG